MFSKSSCGDEPALRAHRVGELLARRDRLAADLAGGVHLVLLLDRRDDLGDRDAALREHVRLHPHAHRVLARAEDRDLADARHARHRVVHVDVAVVRQELGVVGAVRRVEREERERARGRLLDRHAEAAHLARQLRLRLHVAHLREDLVDVRVGADLEVHVQRAVAGVGVDRVHVDRVVDAAHLLLDRRGDRVLGRERVGADVGRRELDRRRRDLGELRDRQLHERHDAEHRHQDRDHDRDDRAAYEELGHSSVLRVLPGRRGGDVGSRGLRRRRSCPGGSSGSPRPRCGRRRRGRSRPPAPSPTFGPSFTVRISTLSSGPTTATCF